MVLITFNGVIMVALIDSFFSGPDYKKPSFEHQQSYQGNGGTMQAAGGPGMGSEQVTTDTVRPLLLPCFFILFFFFFFGVVFTPTEA